MKNAITNALDLLFPLSVARIEKRIARDIERLKTLAANHRASALAHEDIAEDFYDYADESHDAADRAEQLATRMAELMR